MRQNTKSNITKITTRPASKHTNHTTPPSYHNTHKNSLSLSSPRLLNHPSKYALQYTIKITCACVQNSKSNITKITPLASKHTTIPHRHLTITLTKTHSPLSSPRHAREPPLKICTSIHYQNHVRMRPKQQIKYHKNNTTRLASKHTNHTTAPSYHNTHKNSHSNVVATTSRTHPSKYALQYTIKITHACAKTLNQISQNNTTHRIKTYQPYHSAILP